MQVTVCARTIDANDRVHESSIQGKFRTEAFPQDVRPRASGLPIAAEILQQNKATEEEMKTVTAILSLLMLSSVASAQSPDPSKWMCRNLADSGGFTYQGETIFGTQACRPIPQGAPATSAAPATAAAPKQEATMATVSSSVTAPVAAATPQPTSNAVPASAETASSASDGKTRVFVTDSQSWETRGGSSAGGNRMVGVVVAGCLVEPVHRQRKSLRL